MDENLFICAQKTVNNNIFISVHVFVYLLFFLCVHGKHPSDSRTGGNCLVLNHVMSASLNFASWQENVSFYFRKGSFYFLKGDQVTDLSETDETAVLILEF